MTPVFDSYFNQLQTDHSYNTRQASKGNIYLTGVNTTQYGKRSATYAGGILWNTLSVELRKSPSLQTFKKSLQALYLSAYPCLHYYYCYLLIWFRHIFAIILCIIIITVIIIFGLIFSVVSLYFFIHCLFFLFLCNIKYSVLGVCCPVQSLFSSWMKLEFHSYLYCCLNCCCSKI